MMDQTKDRRREIKDQGINARLIFLSLVFCLWSLSGCMSEYNLATGREEKTIYTTEKEVNIGTKIASQVEKKFKINTDVDINDKVKSILTRIAAVCDRQEIVYFVKIIDEDVMNAVSLPGGYIYLFRGVLDKAENDDEIAGVIAHEVGHITARHSIKRLQMSYGAILVQVLAAEAGGKVAGGVSLAINSIFTEFSQSDEFEADRLSVKYLTEAGFNPLGVKTFLEKMMVEKEKEPRRQYSYWRTHPYMSQRISAVNAEINGKLEFRDYLNLIDTDKYKNEIY